jgi:hypothetical protein
MAVFPLYLGRNYVIWLYVRHCRSIGGMSVHQLGQIVAVVDGAYAVGDCGQQRRSGSCLVLLLYAHLQPHHHHRIELERWQRRQWPRGGDGCAGQVVPSVLAIRISTNAAQ